MKDKHPTAHTLLAGFADFYFASFLFLSVLGLTLSNPQGSPVLLLIGMVVILLSTIVYHSVYQQKCHFLTVGERIASKHLRAGKKVWENPYKKSKTLLYVVIIVTLLFTGSEMNLFLLPDQLALPIILRIVKLGLIYWGLTLIGQGRPNGAWPGILMYGLAAALSFYFFTLGEPMAFDAFLSSGIMTALYIGLLYYYHKAK